MTIVDRKVGEPLEIPENPEPGLPPENEIRSLLAASRDVFTRKRLRPRNHPEQNRFVFIAAGGIVVAILVFIGVSMPRHSLHDSSQSLTRLRPTEQTAESTGNAAEKSLFPIIESQKAASQTQRDGFLNEDDLERTTRGKPNPSTPRTPANTANSLASIPPFGGQDNWQAPQYQTPVAVTGESVKADREATEKSSLAYVQSASLHSNSGFEKMAFPVEDLGLGLRVGTKLRARLETAVSSAVHAPLLAVIEYNYEWDGEIIVPAGAKAVGTLQDADRSGYVRLQFESLLMPDGATVPLRALATDLGMKPLRGKVEGKHTGRNILVRSLSGIGQAGAMLVGRGSLDQPLSESDLLRERISNNIGEASDEQTSKLNFTQHIVVTIPADTPINLIVEQAAIPTPLISLASPDTQLRNSNTEELRRLLQLQKELSQNNPPQN